MTPTQPPCVNTARYAAYFAPHPSNPWWEAGSQWLGRCAATGTDLPQPLLPGVGAEMFRRLTAEPARYGWHATLKAPFALATGVSVSQLERRLAAVCAELTPFDIPTLKVKRLGHFLALVPHPQLLDIRTVADACVTTLHSFSAPLPAPELARRRGAGLSPRQEELLLTWGYPRVFDQFQFHFSLTGNLEGVPETVCAALKDAATAWFSELPTLRFDAVALFIEPARGKPMQLAGRWPFGSSRGAHG